MEDKQLTAGWMVVLGKGVVVLREGFGEDAKEVSSLSLIEAKSLLKMLELAIARADAVEEWAPFLLAELGEEKTADLLRKMSAEGDGRVFRQDLFSGFLGKGLFS